MKKILLYLYLLYIIFLGTIIDIAGFIFYFFFNGIFLFDFIDKIFYPNNTLHLITLKIIFSVMQYNILLVLFNIFLAISIKHGINLLFNYNNSIKNIILTFLFFLMAIYIFIYTCVHYHFFQISLGVLVTCNV